MARTRIIDRASTKQLFKFMIEKKLTRRALINTIHRRMYQELVVVNPDNRPRRVQEGKHALMMGLLHGFDRAMSRGFISKHVVRRMLDTFLENVALSEQHVRNIAASLGFRPPLFVVVSPTGRCNLRCVGCYAASGPEGAGGNLSFDVFDRILREKREMWDSHFTVISGGEPLLWRDNGRDILDMAARHPTDLFMMYTNGTLITDDVARRMAELGNITPAVSVEGFEKETDERRGKGVYAKTLTAFENLRRHGVVFGISVTPTRKNWQVATSDEFVDFYFDRQGVVYCWVFQYMPVGRGPSLDLMVSPPDRVEMLRRTERFVRERKVFYADFWNSGIASSGCISAGRPGGYFYIDWNGDVMPCVFVPYAVDNINDVYRRGENINVVLKAPFFQKIRDWQNNYGYAQPAEDVHNWLCPCPVRDHFSYVRDSALETNARPINEEAAAALKDPAYYDGMAQYDREVEELTAPLWQEWYAEVPAPREAESLEEARV